jgi:hypothetical protein
MIAVSFQNSVLMYFPSQIHAEQQTQRASNFSSRVQLEQGNQGAREHVSYTYPDGFNMKFSFLQVDIFTLRLFLS